MLNRCIKIHSLHAREKGEGQGGTHKYLNQRTKDNMQSRMESQWHQVVAEDEVIKDGLEKESETGINICLEEKVQVLQPVQWHSKGVQAPGSGNAVLEQPCRGQVQWNIETNSIYFCLCGHDWELKPADLVWNCLLLWTLGNRSNQMQNVNKRSAYLKGRIEKYRFETNCNTEENSSIKTKE